MTSYTYTDLREDEIRLLRLLPANGNFTDDICIILDHAPLIPRDMQSRWQTRLYSKIKLTEQLPNGWRVFITPEGKPFFRSRYGKVQYEHPNAAIDARLYEEPIEDTRNNSQPDYEALSYVWGSPDDSVSVSVCEDDTAHFKPLEERVMFSIKIRRNLADALRHLRLVDKHQTLWVDAVCINQRNLAERSREVTRMGMIYRQARRVIAWLGTSTSGSGQALAALSNLAKLVEISDDGWIFPSTNNKSNWRPRLDKPPLDDETWVKLEDLFFRPYFDRLWIVQELRLASQHSLIQCGDDTLTLSELRRATEALLDAKHVPVRLCMRMVSVSSFTRSHTKFIELLGQSRSRQCLDMRDKIYSLLSLAPPQLAARIEPDYTISYQDVYKKFCLSYMHITARLDLLPLCGNQRSAETCATFASWILDLSSAPRKTVRPGVMQAAANSRSQYTYVPPHRLDVTGIRHARVVTRSASIPPDIAQAAKLLETHQPIGWSGKLYPTDESVLDAWIRLLQVDTLQDRIPNDRQSPLLKDLKTRWSDAVTQDQTPREKSLISPRTIERLHGASLIELDNGYLGFGPSTARPGDCLVVLLGCYAPMILRPQENGAYIVIGQCYVQGLMDGEALLGDLPTSWTVQQHRNDGAVVFEYYNSDTTCLTSEDPRLPPLDEGWRKVWRPRTPR
ncbi:unnamed protein product [Alternaria alternata]|uniref:Heterokaryon incompatibility domain-containing protein n=1 Tax=Alternaria tenuissima TaxID=119927 RepID=A0A4Q4LYU8_9PLEO|nr:hypothetical protein AA0114_g12548 [Alternaria tenuissima]